MTREEYKLLSRWVRTARRTKLDTYASQQERWEQRQRITEAYRQLGWRKQSEFGRWLSKCRDRRTYLLQAIADRKHSEQYLQSMSKGYYHEQ